MPPRTPKNADPNKVWISREEYERLRAAENAQQQVSYGTSMYATAAVVGAPAADHSASNKLAQQQKIIALFLAICLIVSLSTSLPGLLAGGIMAAFLIYSVIGIFDYRRLRKQETQFSGTTTDTASRPTPSAVKKLLIIIGILLLLPVVGYAMFIGFFIFLFTVGGGPGS